MKIGEIIDVNGKLYKITYVNGDEETFGAEYIGEVVAKCFTRPQSLDRTKKLAKLRSFCSSIDGCRGCALELHKDCVWERYTDEELDEACEIIMKGDK